MLVKRKPFDECSILIVGLVRNCASQLPIDVDRMALAFCGAKSLNWLLIESDSDDNTVEVLSSLKKKISDFDFLTLGVLREKYPLRTDRIANCRNNYVREIRENPVYRGIDYIVVSDFDGLNTHINEAAILSCWEYDDWDICTANQNGPYYDIWALRHEEWSPNDCWEQYKFLSNYNADTKKNLHNAVCSRMIRIPADSDWIEVESAFGGLAIYPKKVFDDSSYVGITSSGKEICEHVPFHTLLRRKGYRIAINPRLINAAYTEQTVMCFFSLQVKKKLKRTIKMVIGQGSVNVIKKILRMRS